MSGAMSLVVKVKARLPKTSGAANPYGCFESGGLGVKQFRRDAELVALTQRIRDGEKNDRKTRSWTGSGVVVRHGGRAGGRGHA